MEANFTVLENPGYIEIFEFEKYDHEGMRIWLQHNWSFIVYLSALYVGLIAYGKKWMADRKPFKLKRPLILWNFALALFSFVVFIRMVPELIVEISQEGFFSSLCHFRHHNLATSLWGVTFCLSKILDFGDTFWLIISKKPVIFLHWYHHASVAIYCIYVADSSDPSSRYFAVINSFVHTVMYSYYGLKAMGVKIPRAISMFITSLQISQMIFGIYINVITYYYKSRGTLCDRPYWNIEVALMMYASYLVLFAHFFYKAYISSSTQAKIKQK